MAKMFYKPCYGLLTVSIYGKADKTYCYNTYETRSRIVAIISRWDEVKHYTILPSETYVKDSVAERATRELIADHLQKTA